jgi:hypothetical protein
MSIRKYIALAFLGIASTTSFAFASADETRRAFAIEFQGIKSDLSIITTSILPGTKLRVKATAAASATTGHMALVGNDWVWTAPREPGLAVLSFERGGETITLNVFVLTPFENGEETALNGYRIGAYRQTLFRGMQSYAAPRGFIDLSHGPADLKIAPHFTLGQFICKQQPGHDPTYLLIRPATVLKLETLLEAANAKGWEGNTFYVMSGFRTPFYNASIGNKTTSSRHLYGGAADIWLDSDGDGRMDDLNGDGVINKDDARALGNLASELAATGGSNWPTGGIGVYGANAAHGPFVHIDARGYQARWGQ